MKLAILDDETVVPYDHLFLCTGNQFHVIAPMQVTVINPLSRKTMPPKFDRILFGMMKFSMKQYFVYLFCNLEPAPPNVLTINDDFDAAMALKWLRMNHHAERRNFTIDSVLLFLFLKDSILIYGATLESYCCINALIFNGIPSNSIKLIFPPDHENVIK